MQILDTDLLIVGSGAAGLRAAVAASESGVNVTVLDKGDAANCTEWADKNFEITGGGGCGLAAPVYPPDCPEKYFEDLAKVAGGRNLSELTSIFAKNSGPAVRYLQNKGVRFVEQADRGLKAVPEMWHSYPRILYSRYGTGKEVRRVLKKEALASGVNFINKARATKLMTVDNTLCGCLVLKEESQEIAGIRCKSLVLATGGAGGLFLNSSSHSKITGDGVMLAAEAGAEFINMELYSEIPLSVSPTQGIGLVPHLLLAGENLTVDKILHSRTFTWQLDEVKFSPATIQATYPETYKKLTASGFDWVSQGLEFRWVAHFMLGGVKINHNSETSVRGLFAAGEIAGGITGVGRLPGTGIMEGLVFGEIAGKNAARQAQNKAFYQAHREMLQKTYKQTPKLSTSQLNQLKAIQGVLAGLITQRLSDKKNEHIGTLAQKIENLERQTDSVLNTDYSNFAPALSQLHFFHKLKNSLCFSKLYTEAMLNNQ